MSNSLVTETNVNNNGKNDTYREGLWSKVSSRREEQLHSFTLNELIKVAESLLERDKPQALSSSSPEEKWRKHIKIVLESYFNRACNEDLSQNERRNNFIALKSLFDSFDRICAEKSKKKKGSSPVSLESGSVTRSIEYNSLNQKQNQTRSATEEGPKEKDIVTIADSGDEDEHSQVPINPNMSQNYELLTMISIRADEHKKTSHSPYSGSISERPAVDINLEGMYSVTEEGGQDAIRRLTKWDPNFIIRENLVILQTLPPLRISRLTKIKTALAFKFTIPKSYASHPDLKWKSTLPANVSTEGKKFFLMLRMLPKIASEKYPDTHIWPKGTFLQLNSVPIRLIQRKQQSHDDKLWKSMCNSFDLTPHIDPLNNRCNTIELISYDENIFYLHLAVVEYTSNLMSSVTNVIPYQTSLQQARYYVNRQTVKLDDDDDKDEQTKNCIPLTFSLSCPISMIKISTPVRGKKCEHIQCFDLFAFQSSNSFPSARRWRCVLCEKFTSVDELVICQMFTTLLEKFGNSIVPGSKDKVELKIGDDGCSNENWVLLDQKLQGRGGASDEQESSIQNSRRNQVEEIIIV